MPNTYLYTGPGTRYTVGDPTSKTLLDITRTNVDHVQEAVASILDSTNPENGLTATQADPLVLTAGSGVFLALWLVGTSPTDFGARMAMATTAAAVRALALANTGVDLGVGGTTTI